MRMDRAGWGEQAISGAQRDRRLAVLLPNTGPRHNVKELQRYIETRDRKRAARRAMRKLISGTEVSNPTIRFDNEAKKT